MKQLSMVCVSAAIFLATASVTHDVGLADAVRTTHRTLVEDQQSALLWEEEVASYGREQQEKSDTLTKIRTEMQHQYLKIQSEKKERFGLFEPSVKGCDICHVSFDVLLNLIMTPGLEHDVKDLINATCAIVDHDRKICEEIADGLINFLHKAEAYGQKSGFNTTVVACTTVLGLCTVPCCVTPNTPEQVHLSLMDGNAVQPQDGTTAMRVSWVTSMQYPDGPRVDYSSLAATPKHAMGTSSTYEVTGWKGWLHTAVMTGLQPGTSYGYMVGPSGNGSSTSTSLESTFMANFTTFPPNLGSEQRPLRLITIADMGMGGTHRETIAKIQTLVEAGAVDMILHTGDISYADGDAYRWDAFMREMTPSVSRVPYMTTPGNHEGLFNFTGYKKRFPHASTGYGGPDDAMYYAFSVGPIRFVMLDSETEWDSPRMDPVQVAWTNRVMDEANDQGQFIFVGMHRPLYCSDMGDNTKNCGADAKFLRSKLESTLLRQGAGIVHTGHVHNYERSYPVYESTVISESYTNTSAPMYFVNGAAGCEEGLTTWLNTTVFKPWSATHQDRTSFLLLTMSQQSSGEDQQQELNTKSRLSDGYNHYQVNMTLVSSKSGAIFDDLVLTKNVPKPGQQ